MGLDMYLRKKTYIGANYEHRNVRAKIDIKIEGKTVPINESRISEISEAVMYWRKDNHIHRWFVEHVQEGEDDCGAYAVDREQLTELQHACEAVLTDREAAKETLPTASGFFFGGVEYDEYYFEACKKTALEIKALLEEPQIEGAYVEFEYQSSW